MAKLRTSGWRGGSVMKWRKVAGGDLEKFKSAAEQDGYDLGDAATNLMNGSGKPKAPNGRRKVAVASESKREAFPFGVNNQPKEKPTMEEVSKIKAIIDQMGLERVKAAMKVAEDIA